MPKALVISEDSAMTGQIRNKLAHAGWVAESATMISMMAQGHTLVSNKSCSIVIVDNGFNRYGNLVNEMRPAIRDFSHHAPLYLIFKGEYDRIFDTWATYAKRTFQSTLNPQRAAMAIAEIIRLESNTVPRESYYSPMDAI